MSTRQSSRWNWELNLEQGEWFEENVTRPWIHRHRPGWWITDSRNHQRRHGRGPRMVCGDEELVLPDFRLDDPATGRGMWIDSKLKKRPFSIPGRQGERFYSLDPAAYTGYQRLMVIFNHMPFEVIIGCSYTNIIWLLDLFQAQPLMHEFDNQYVKRGQHLTPCFSTTQMRMVGRWNVCDLPGPSAAPLVHQIDLDQ
jgi:hypothetical protein